jgi:hypothetical protein
MADTELGQMSVDDLVTNMQSAERLAIEEKGNCCKIVYYKHRRDELRFRHELMRRIREKRMLASIEGATKR